MNIFILMNTIYKSIIIKSVISEVNKSTNFTEINLIPTPDIFNTNNNAINIFDPIFINFVLN